MRIAYLSVSDQLGGSEAMLLEVVAQIRRARPAWQFHLIVPGDGPLGPLARACGMNVDVLPMPASLARLGEWGLRSGRRGRAGIRLVRAAFDLPSYERQLRGLLAAINPDVVHSNGFKAHVVSARTHDPARALVWHMHEYVSRRPVTRSLLKRYAGRCSAVVANSRSVADDVRSVISDRGVIRTIYNAVDLDRFSPTGETVDLDALAGLPPATAGTIRVGLVATYSRWKGHDVFLRALRTIPSQAGIRAYVIGGAVYQTQRSQYSREELETMARTHGVADRVGFTGFVAASERAFRALDVVVHASTTPEPFGLVIAEAMACGRAVVTSAAGGSSELVRDGHDATVHTPGDPSSLADAIGRLAADAPLRARLGAAARQTALQRFDATRLAREFGDLYEDVREGAVVRR